MVKVRTAKAKGSAMEYTCQHSLSKIYPDIIRTAERGYQRQYDLECEEAVFECKRLKAISWNQAKNFFDKLQTVKPNEKVPYLLFQSNRQPCLVMYVNNVDKITIQEFEDVFGVPFEKHPSSRVQKK